MASSTREPEEWSTRARPPTADDPSGPNRDATAPLLDPLNAAFAPPAPDDTRIPRRPESASAGLEEPIYAPPRRRSAPPGQRPRRVKQVRRVRRTLRHIDPFSVLKVSLMFYGCFLVLWLAFVAIAFWVGQSAGIFDWVEKTLRGLTLVKGSWGVSLSFLEKWAFFIGLAVAVVMSLVNLFLAFLYNIVADVIGGVDMTFVERD